MAAAALAAGRLSALPTETVYGLGARADVPGAVARVYAAKGRPADHPLIAHVLDAAALDTWARQVPDYARALADRFWPGPLTIVVPRAPHVGDAVTGGQDTIAIRVPAHALTRAVLARLADLTGDRSVAVAAPSANRFGRVSPTTAEHVIAELGGVLREDDVVLDGGRCTVGVESTIVDCTGSTPAILRPGGVDVADVEAITGLRCGVGSGVRAPGTLAAHYAPRARVVLVEDHHLDVAVANAGVDPDRIGVLALVDEGTPEGAVRLAAPASAAEYAKVLYAALREADALDLEVVLAVPPGPDGIGAAVTDRLRRAAFAGQP